MGVESFMDDLLDCTDSNPDDSRERVLNGDVFLWLCPGINAVRLKNIRSLNPGFGDGTEALAWLKSLADRHDVSIVGDAEPTGNGPLSATSLKLWYRRNGFEVSSSGGIEYTPESER